MFHVKVHGVINKLIFVLRIFGLWDRDHGINNFNKRKLFALILIGTFVTSLAVKALNTDFKDEVVYSAALALIHGVQFVRLVYIIWKKNEIFEFIYQSGCHTIDDFEESTRVNNKIEKFTKYATYFLSAVIGTGLLVPICFAILGVKQLPVELAFPFDWKNNEIGYWSVFTFFLLVVLYTAVIFSLNVVIWYILLNFSIKYELLGNDLRRLGETEDSYSKDLVAAIKNHQNLKGTIEKFRSCFSNLFFLQIVTSGACICGSVYSLAFSSHQDLLLSYVYVVVLSYSIFDIFMIMYLGNEVEDASDQLSYSLFESNWIEQSKSCKKSMIIFAEMLKQPHQLVICVLYPLNLVTFLRIIDLAYNMFNILKNLN